MIAAISPNGSMLALIVIGTFQALKKFRARVVYRSMITVVWIYFEYIFQGPFVDFGCSVPHEAIWKVGRHLQEFFRGLWKLYIWSFLLILASCVRMVSLSHFYHAVSFHDIEKTSPELSQCCVEYQLPKLSA